jgi:hypothetical protein
MQQAIEFRLQAHRDKLQHLKMSLDQQMLINARQRNGHALRFLHGQISMHQLVIDELEQLLLQIHGAQNK